MTFPYTTPIYRRRSEMEGNSPVHAVPCPGCDTGWVWSHMSNVRYPEALIRCWECASD